MRLLVASVISLGAMSMVLFGTWQSSIPFVSPGDLSADLEGRRVQVEGIVRALEPLDEGLGFDLSGGSASVPVRYRYGAGRPLTLEDGRVAVAKGVYADGILQAQQVSVRAHEGIEP